MVRGLALRSLCSLRLPTIVEYIEGPLRVSESGRVQGSALLAHPLVECFWLCWGALGLAGRSNHCATVALTCARLLLWES